MLAPEEVSSNVEKLRTDAFVAQETRDALAPLLKEICAVMDRARTAGLSVAFNFQPNQYGKFHVPEVVIVRPL